MTAKAYRSMRDAINDLLACAYKYDDKPHLLFSCLRRLAGQFAAGKEQTEILRLMDYAYEHRGKPAPTFVEEVGVVGQTPTLACSKCKREVDADWLTGAGTCPYCNSLECNAYKPFRSGCPKQTSAACPHRDRCEWVE